MNRMNRSARSRFRSTQSRFRTLLLVALLPMATAIHCGSGDNIDRTIVNAEWAPFIEIAKHAVCADKRNRLYAIDDMLVFSERAGSCQDAAFADVLFGATPDDVLCDYHDTIAGPQKSCSDQGYAAMFDTIITHLDQADLGLGPNHTVVRIPF
jgi:hypothetical protein